MKLEPIISQIISILTAAQTASKVANEFCPTQVIAFSMAELSNEFFPRVLVGIGSGAKYESDSVLPSKEFYKSEVAPTVYVQAENKVSPEYSVSDGIRTVDWVVDALVGQSVSVGNENKQLGEVIEIDIMEDVEPFTAIIKLVL